ncbi:MAG: GntR family transcriptional regulator [Lentisphaeria bacterium]|nr:GntR family transcriptional regulator [Lentisphaeria bacterium]
MIATPATPRSQVKEALLENIRHQDVGTRLAPERRLAEEFGVSRSTMTKVLEELVKEGYLSRRVGSGTFIMPHDSEIASTRLPIRALGEVLIASPDFFSFPLWEKLHNLEIGAMRSNLQVVNLKIHPESDFNSLFELADGCRNLLGVILNAGLPTPKPVLKKLDELGVPVVIIGELESVGLYRNICTVGSNHFQSGYLKMEALLKAGHTRIGFIPNEPQSVAQQECIRGMKEAVREYKLRWRDLVLPESSIEFWQDPMKSGCVQTREVLERAPDVTGLVVDTIPGAIGALRAIAESGRSCPHDVSIVTALSYAGIEEYTFPSLSNVTVSGGKISRTALDMILHREQFHSRELIIDVEFNGRESIRNLNGE